MSRPYKRPTELSHEREDRKRKLSPAQERRACFFSHIGLAIWSLWDGSVRFGEFGWKIAPRLGRMFDLMTGYTIPFLFAGLFGTVGSFLGIAAAIGCAVEAILQLFLSYPYRRPISRMLIDWVPAG